MDQQMFFIILIFFLLTNEFYYLITNIIKYGLYGLILIYILNMIFPNYSIIIKNWIIYFLNSSTYNLTNDINNDLQYDLTNNIKYDIKNNVNNVVNNNLLDTISKKNYISYIKKFINSFYS